MMEFFLALVTIILIDIVLGGENALVIALASRNLPLHLKHKAILWGTVGAVVARFVCVVILAWLLLIPGLRLVGGLALVWIAWRLGQHQESAQVPGKTTLFGAISTIVLADFTMGLDNSLAIAGASGGSWLLIILGLLISVPIIVWGATWIQAHLERRPWLVYWGAGVLYLVATKMILDEPILANWLQALDRWVVTILPVLVAVQLACTQYYRQKIKS
jgi:YjbE family integral membrane protein